MIHAMIRLMINLGGAVALCMLATQTFTQTVKTQPAAKSDNPLVTALWFSHMYAEPQALTPSKDRQLKSTLVGAIRAENPGLSWDSVREVFEKRVFQTLASDDNLVTVPEMERMLRDKNSRPHDDLFSKVRHHAGASAVRARDETDESDSSGRGAAGPE